MYISTLPLTSAPDLSGGLKPRLGRFTPGCDPVLIIQEAGWTPEPVWTGTQNLVVPGFDFLDRPAHSESLYRLTLFRPT
jgi:hypothetical protein